ncbi:MAG: UDP-2,3-diacylglucosamine diphosphatase [Bacteroidales bacterium]|nr:UDP-2,3-diacylglucosamine diphosphatase [Bacteroidales bacterium]
MAKIEDKALRPLTVVSLGQKDILFVSDAHLGSGADSRERERELCLLLAEKVRPGMAVVLLGDMVDFWFSYRYTVPRGFSRLIGKLSELCDSGVEIHYFTGNHDMWMFSYLTEECGLTLHTDEAVLEAAGKRFLVGHGDAQGSPDRMFKLWRRMFRSHFNQRLFALLPPALTFPIAHRWSDHNKRRHLCQGPARYLGAEREGIVRYCQARLQVEHYDYCVFGHRHTPVATAIAPGSTYVNLGDWLYRRNYALFSAESGLLTLHDRHEECGRKD